MRPKARIAILFICSVCFAGAGPKGTPPKSSASLYPAHAERQGVAIGAAALPPAQAKKLFVSDVNRCCTVVEVAIYPASGGPAEISLNDFVLRVEGTDVALKPSSAKVAAASLQKKVGSDREVRISPGVGVGYETGGYDPVSGRRGGGVYTDTGVGVGTGSAGPKPGSTEKDRTAMEAELSEKGLPEGSASAPVAGYIYFPIPNKKNTTHVLEYTLNGKKLVLTLPPTS